MVKLKLQNLYPKPNYSIFFSSFFSLTYLLQIAQANAQNSAFIEWKKIEALKELADTLSLSSNVTYIPGSNNMLLNLNQAPPRRPVTDSK
jgi:hypothetical protein